MNEAVTDIIVARSREQDRLSTMIVWSMAAHIVVTAAIMLAPAPESAAPPANVMTISLGGAPGPRTGGMTQMGARPVQAPPPEEVRRAESAPAPKAPEMTLPDPKARKAETAKPDKAPADATSRTATTGEKPAEGTAKAETQVRGQGFGLSSAGGTGGQMTIDAANFCCPGYLVELQDRITASWRNRQGFIGITTMKFTIARDGTIRDPQVEKSSGFAALDIAAQRALALARLSRLPGEYPNPTLTVHLEFVYSQR